MFILQRLSRHAQIINLIDRTDEESRLYRPPAAHENLRAEAAIRPKRYEISPVKCTKCIFYYEQYKIMKGIFNSMQIHILNQVDNIADGCNVKNSYVPTKCQNSGVHWSL